MNSCEPNSSENQEFVIAVTQIALDSIPQARIIVIAEGFYLRNQTSILVHIKVPDTRNEERELQRSFSRAHTSWLYNIVHSDKGWWFISLLMFIMNKRKEFGKSLV